MKPLLLAAVSLLVLLTSTAAAQSNRPLVVFILENDLQTASIADPGPDGVSRFGEMFRGLGAEARFARLSEPLPEEARVVVLPRPLRPLSNDMVARLWAHLERGNHLLLAIDPVGYPDRRIEEGRAALWSLVGADYGLSLLDTFVAEPWFTTQSIGQLPGSLVATYGDTVAHPIIEPLARYGMPVMTWGARNVDVEPFGIRRRAGGLLITHSAYGDTNRNVFNGDVLELNIGNDLQGELVVAGFGENTRSGSRVALLGDAEMIQNGYGLSQTVTSSGAERPRFPGNTVLLERLGAWLLELPAAQWPPLPEGFTWIGIDGSAEDWHARLPTPAVDDPAQIIDYVRVFRNDEYLYLLARRAGSTATRFELQMTLTPQLSATPPVKLVAGVDGVVVSGETAQALPDAAFATGDFLEVRIPLRVVGNSDVLEISELCLTEASVSAGCIEQSISVRRVTERDPVPLRHRNTPLATVNNPGANTVNLRAGAGTDFPPVAGLPNGTIMAIIGRNEAGDWLYVESARYAGWLFSSLAVANADVSWLPVIAAVP